MPENRSSLPFRDRSPFHLMCQKHQQWGLSLKSWKKCIELHNGRDGSHTKAHHLQGHRVTQSEQVTCLFFHPFVFSSVWSLNLKKKALLETAKQRGLSNVTERKISLVRGLFHLCVINLIFYRLLIFTEIFWLKAFQDGPGSHKGWYVQSEKQNKTKHTTWFSRKTELFCCEFLNHDASPWAVRNQDGNERTAFILYLGGNRHWGTWELYFCPNFHQRITHHLFFCLEEINLYGLWTFM